MSHKSLEFICYVKRNCFPTLWNVFCISHVFIWSAAYLSKRRDIPSLFKLHAPPPPVLIGETLQYLWVPKDGGMFGDVPTVMLGWKLYTFTYILCLHLEVHAHLGIYFIYSKQCNALDVDLKISLPSRCHVSLGLLPLVMTLFGLTNLHSSLQPGQ